ncbi:MAG TPA: orotidine-5'-phosphate decarboxylase [Candidatus Thermoplasmatota archaeon]|nr:orotidine-5'-phosphate decarboxylase [Candidatus Thermoplasmatota archaeon]
MQDFRGRLRASAARSGSWLCLGLDPDPAAYPDGMGSEDTLEYCLGIVEACAPHACAVKPNAAFFEALGDVGQEALADLVARMPPGLPVILDGKRNDIGTTATKYAEAAFDELGVDAVTVTPYLGRDTVEPFARHEGKGVFLLARTSNPSAPDVQDLVLADGSRLWEAVARQVRAWDGEYGNLGMVAGATYPEELAAIRRIAGEAMPLLVPGVGAQGADAAETLRRGAAADGAMAVVNVGRAILHAAKTSAWREEAAAAAKRFAEQLRWRPA